MDYSLVAIIACSQVRARCFPGIFLGDVNATLCFDIFIQDYARLSLVRGMKPFLCAPRWILVGISPKRCSYWPGCSTCDAATAITLPSSVPERPLMLVAIQHFIRRLDQGCPQVATPFTKLEPNCVLTIPVCNTHTPCGVMPCI
jgi:hypothetical protein